jgi:hypothetical protein
VSPTQLSLTLLAYCSLCNNSTNSRWRDLLLCSVSSLTPSTISGNKTAPCAESLGKNLNLYPNLLCCAMQCRFEITLDILNINYRKEYKYNTSLKTVLGVLLPTNRVDLMSTVIMNSHYRNNHWVRRPSVSQHNFYCSNLLNDTVHFQEKLYSLALHRRRNQRCPSTCHRHIINLEAHALRFAMMLMGDGRLKSWWQWRDTKNQVMLF